MGLILQLLIVRELGEVCNANEVQQLFNRYT